jgi:pyridoxal phosphate enzyme (YggS family)
VDSIKDRWLRVRELAAEAALRANRDPDTIQIMAVSKTMPMETILEARNAGITLFGENRVQEALRKFGDHTSDFFDTGAKLHLIGHLQTNKARKALELFDMIQSVDRERLAQVLSRIADESDRIIPVLIEVNTSGEESKFGVEPEQALELTKQVASYPNLKVQGFMTVGAWLPDPEQVRPEFRLLRETRDRIEAESIPNVSTEILSMGMTNDFEVAIEEGSTMVRIGTAIFGPRNA